MTDDGIRDPEVLPPADEAWKSRVEAEKLTYRRAAIRRRIHVLFWTALILVCGVGVIYMPNEGSQLVGLIISALVCGGIAIFAIKRNRRMATAAIVAGIGLAVQTVGVLLDTDAIYFTGMTLFAVGALMMAGVFYRWAEVKSRPN